MSNSVARRPHAAFQTRDPIARSDLSWRQRFPQPQLPILHDETWPFPHWARSPVFSGELMHAAGVVTTLSTVGPFRAGLPRPGLPVDRFPRASSPPRHRRDARQLHDLSALPSAGLPRLELPPRLLPPSPAVDARTGGSPSSPPCRHAGERAGIRSATTGRVDGVRPPTEMGAPCRRCADRSDPVSGRPPGMGRGAISTAHSRSYPQRAVGGICCTASDNCRSHVPRTGRRSSSRRWHG